MKTRHIVEISALACICWAMSSCVTTKTTVTAPDGTVTVTETTTPAPGSIEAGTHVVDTVVDGKSGK